MPDLDGPITAAAASCEDRPVMHAPDRVQDPAARLQHALDLAYHYLSRRDRTVLEVRRHLESKRVEPATIEAALGELSGQRYLDDVRYATVFAEDRRNLDGWGVERIERKLVAAGVPGEVVLEVLGERTQEEELDAALQILRRKLREPPEDEREREQALGLLVRRGYELDLAYSAVRAFERRVEAQRRTRTRAAAGAVPASPA